MNELQAKYPYVELTEARNHFARAAATATADVKVDKADVANPDADGDGDADGAKAKQATPAVKAASDVRAATAAAKQQFDCVALESEDETATDSNGSELEYECELKDLTDTPAVQKPAELVGVCTRDSSEVVQTATRAEVRIRTPPSTPNPFRARSLSQNPEPNLNPNPNLETNPNPHRR